jgi:hypothetical protein
VHELKLGKEAEQIHASLHHLLSQKTLNEDEVTNFFHGLGWHNYDVGKKLKKQKGFNKSTAEAMRKALERKLVREEKPHVSKGFIENPEGRAKARVVFIFQKNKEPADLNELRDFYDEVTSGHSDSIDSEYNPTEHTLGCSSVHDCETKLKAKLGITKFGFQIPSWGS